MKNLKIEIEKIQINPPLFLKRIESKFFFHSFKLQEKKKKN